MSENELTETPIKLIADERQRQIDKEGFSLRHDDLHVEDELANAAACYALNYRIADKEIWDKPLVDLIWPFYPGDYKPEESRIRNLVKAGALIVAEIERLQRIAAAAQPERRMNDE